MRQFRILGSDRGSAAVEFALVVPLILLLLFGLIDFGRLYWAKMSVVAASSEAVRAVALNASLTDAEVKDRAATVASGWSASAITVSVTRCPTPIVATASAEVIVQLQFGYVTPIGKLFGTFGGTSLGYLSTVSARGVYRCLV